MVRRREPRLDIYGQTDIDRRPHILRSRRASPPPICEARHPSFRGTLLVPMPHVETFPNPAPHRDYVITHICPEFTSVCPKTGQPDFATIELEYIPDQTCLELKALKLYYYSFRNEGIYYEAVTNRILDELVEACSPRWMRITANFNVRGGIESVIVAESGPQP